MNPNLHTPLHPSFFNPLERYSEAEWEQLTPEWRSELETQYVRNHPVLREKVERGLESYHHRQGYLPTELNQQRHQSFPREITFDVSS